MPRVISLLNCVWLGTALLLSSCARKPQEGGQATPEVLVSTPVSRPVTNYVEFIGRTDAVESVEVKARVTGYLTAIYFTPGTEVRGGERPIVSATRTIGLLLSPAVQAHMLTTAMLLPDQGDVLFEIDPRPYQADYDRAAGQVTLQESKLKLAIANLGRADELKKTPGAISQKEYDTYVASKEEAAAAVLAAQANLETYRLNLSFTKVRAAIDGKISRNLLTVGNLVTKDETLLTTIVTVDPMFAYFDVDERTFLTVQDAIRTGKIQMKGPGQAPVEMGLATETGFPHQGTIDFINNKLDPLTGTITLRGVFANPLWYTPGRLGPLAPQFALASFLGSMGGIPPALTAMGDMALLLKKAQSDPRPLTPGLFVRIRVPIGAPEPALLVIDRAIGTDQGLKYLFTVDVEDKVQYRRVTLGALQEDGLRVITSGLSRDERVITDGLQLVRAGMVVKPQERPMPTTP